MSADWFCKIGEKKLGPLNNQQLKTFVAKGQLKPEHLVRRGNEGPWLPAGRIKGLFAAGAAPAQDKPASAKPLPKASAAASLPTAAEPPRPPSDVPRDLATGPQHKKRHARINVEEFDIETTPVMVSRRKVKRGLQALKKSEQKKVTTVLLSIIGGGAVIGVIVLVVAIANNKSSSSAPNANNVADAAAATDSAAKPVTEKNSAKSIQQKPAENKLVRARWPTTWNKVSAETTTVGDVNVMVLRPRRGVAPAGIKASNNEVLVVPVNLQLKDGAQKSVPLTSWADEHLKKSVFLKDDQKEGKGNEFELLGVVPRPGDDAAQVGAKRIQLRLIFEMPAPIPKTMYIALPGAAVHEDGTTIAYEFDNSDVEPAEAAGTPAPAVGEKADAASKQGAK